mgnify:CR=1 FL=1
MITNLYKVSFTDIATERVKAYFNRVLCMAESTEGFQQNDKVAILGEFYYKNNYVFLYWLDCKP